MNFTADELSVRLRVVPVIDDIVLKEEVQKKSDKIELPVGIDVNKIQDDLNRIAEKIGRFSKDGKALPISVKVTGLDKIQKQLDTIIAKIQVQVDSTSVQSSVKEAAKSAQKTLDANTVQIKANTKNAKDEGSKYAHDYAGAIKTILTNQLNILDDPLSKNRSKWESAIVGAQKRLEQLAPYQADGMAIATNDKAYLALVDRLQKSFASATTEAMQFRDVLSDISRQILDNADYNVPTTDQMFAQARTLRDEVVPRQRTDSALTASAVKAANDREKAARKEAEAQQRLYEENQKLAEQMAEGRESAASSRMLQEQRQRAEAQQRLYEENQKSERAALKSAQEAADQYETIYKRVVDESLQLAQTADASKAKELESSIAKNRSALDNMVSFGFVDESEASDIKARVDSVTLSEEKLNSAVHNARQSVLELNAALRNIPDGVIDSSALDVAYKDMIDNPTVENIQRVNTLVADINKQVADANKKHLTIATDADIQKLRTERDLLNSFMPNVQGASQAEGNNLLNNANSILEQARQGAQVAKADLEAAIDAMTRFKAAAKADGSYVQMADPNAIADAKLRFEELGKAWSQLFSHPELAEKYRDILGKFKGVMPDEDLKRVNAEIINFKSECHAAGVTTQTFSDKVAGLFKNFGSMISVTTLLYRAMSVIREMVSNVRELDKVVVDLGIASGNSRAEVKAMMTEYAEMGRQLGVSASDVASAADTFLRQGLSGDDVNTMIEMSTRLSKLGKLEADTASTALTSAMKGYGVSVDDMERVVDMLTAVDQVSASDAGGLATAMSRTAESAQLAGVEMSTLIGYIATVKEVTQGADEEIGTFFKTLFARYSNIKAGNLVDPESAESLSDVETTLNSVGIALRSSNDTFRQFDDVLTEVRDRWEELSNVQQTAIAQAFGGTRNREKFLVLMENLGTAMSYASVATESAGTSAQKYETYTQGMEAKQERLNASMQEFSSIVLDSDLIGGLTDIGTFFITMVNNAARLGGVLPTVVAPLLAIVKAAKNYGELSKVAKSTNLLTADKFAGQGMYIKYLQGLSENERLLSIEMSGLDKASKKSILSMLGVKGALDSTNASAVAMEVTLTSLGKQLLVIAAIAGAVALIKMAVKTQQELNDAAQESNSIYQESLNNIESLQQKIVDLDGKIKEANTLSITDPSDLAMLQQERQELERQLEIEKALNVYRKQEAEKAAAKAANAELYRATLNPNGAKSFGNNVQGSFDLYTSFVDDYEDKINSAEEKLNDAISKNQSRRALRIEQDISKYQEGLKQQESNILRLRDEMQRIATDSGMSYTFGTDLTEDQEDINAFLDKIKELDTYLAKRYGKTSEQKSANIIDVISKEKFEEQRDMLQELASEGKLTEATLNGIKFNGLRSELEAVGISVNDLIEYFNGLNSTFATSGADRYIVANASSYSARSAYDAVDKAMSEYSDVGVISAENVRQMVEVIPGLENALWDETGAWNSAGQEVLKYADNVALATKKAYEAAIAQLELKKQLAVSALPDVNSMAYANQYRVTVIPIEQQIDALIAARDSLGGELSSIFEDDTNNISETLSKLKNGLEEDINTSDLKELLDVYPDLNDEIRAFIDGEIDATELANELQEAIDAEKYGEFNDALEDVNEAIENYGEGSHEVEEALENLGGIVPELNGALYDENGALTAVGRAAIIAASGNREAAIEMLQARAAAIMLDLSNAISQYYAVGDAALDAAQKMAVSNQIMNSKAELADVNAMIATLKAAPTSKASGGGGGGGSSKKDVLEAYKADKKILDHRIKMSEQMQDLYEEESDAWKSEQSKQYDIYKEYASRIQDEMEKLRAKGYDESSEELMQLSEDLADVAKELYEIEKAIWQAGIDSQVEEIEDQIDAENKRWKEREKQLDAEIQRNETLKNLLESQFDITREIRQERIGLEKELANADAQRANGAIDDALFSASDYAVLMSEMDKIDAESVALYNDYVAKINAVSVDEAYNLDLLTTEYETQYSLLSKKYAIAKANLAVTKAQIALQDAQDNRRMAVLVSGRWTWVADSEAISEAVDGIYDAEAERAQAEGDYASEQRTAAMELFIANLEAQKEAEELAHDMLIESLEQLIETLKDMKFAMSDFLAALIDAIAAINAAAASVGSSGGSSGGGGYSGTKPTTPTGPPDDTTPSPPSLNGRGGGDVAAKAASIYEQSDAYKDMEKSAKQQAYNELQSARDRLKVAEIVASNEQGSSIGTRAAANAEVARAKSAVMAAEKKYNSYSAGGVIDYTGLANVHGSRTASEVVFNATDAKKLYDIVRGNPLSEIVKNFTTAVKSSFGALVQKDGGMVQSGPVYNIAGIRFDASASGLTLGELASRLTASAPFM